LEHQFGQFGFYPGYRLKVSHFERLTVLLAKRFEPFNIPDFKARLLIKGFLLTIEPQPI